MLREYYYEKYSINITWDTDSRNSTDKKTLYSSRVEHEDLSLEQKQGYMDKMLTIGSLDGTIVSYPCSFYGVYGRSMDSVRMTRPEDVDVVNKGFHGLPDYRFELTGERTAGFYDPILKWVGKLLRDGTAFLEHYDWVKVQHGDLFNPIRGEGYFLYAFIDDRRELVPYTAYEHKGRGGLIAKDVIKSSKYPKNGIKDGYWWVRGREYTIPPPEIISPDNAFLVNRLEREVVPPLVFKLKKRHANESLKYNARVRLGMRSDFIKSDIILETKEDRTGWEYYNETAEEWQAFPAEGVPGETIVRVQPALDEYEFGFYYWDCASFYPFWQYGMNAQPRMLILITETDSKYYLTINGRAYRAIDLKVKESANGEVGDIKLSVLNNNF